MSKKHGALKDGVIQRRGNKSGTLYKKPGSNVWFMRFSERTPEGKRVRKAWSTGTEDIDEARKRLNAKAEELGYGPSKSEQEHVEALLSVSRSQKDRAELSAQRKAREAAKEREKERAAREDEEEKLRESNAITIASAFSYYTTSKRRPDSSKRTLDGYEAQFETFANWMTQKHPRITKLKEVTPNMAEEFMEHLESTRSRNTRNKYLVFLRTLWRVLRWHPDAQLAVDPWEGIRNLVQTPDEITRKEITIEQLIAIANTIRTGKVCGAKIKDVFTFNGQDLRPEFLLLFAIGIYTGLRLGDCVTLRWDDVNLIKGVIVTKPRKTQRKYNRTVILPIHPTFGAILMEAHAVNHNGFLLKTLAELYLKHEPSMVTNRIQPILRAAGLETSTKGESDGKARTLFGFHSLRHTFASIMLNSGAQFVQVEKMLGHSKESMTMHYFHENATALQSAISTLPRLPQYRMKNNELNSPEAMAEIENLNQNNDNPNPDSKRINEFKRLIKEMTPDERKTAIAILLGQ